MSDQYVGTYRVILSQDDDVSAALVADFLLNQLREFTNTEEGESAELTQLIKFGEGQPTAQEMCDTLAKARNFLIKTKMKDCWAVAQVLDQFIYAFRTRMEEQQVMNPPGYDYDHFVRIAQEVMMGKMAVD